MFENKLAVDGRQKTFTTWSENYRWFIIEERCKQPAVKPDQKNRQYPEVNSTIDYLEVSSGKPSMSTATENQQCQFLFEVPVQNSLIFVVILCIVSGFGGYKFAVRKSQAEGNKCV